MVDTIDEVHSRLGPVYSEVGYDVVRVHAYWKLLLQLIGSAKSVGTLNQAAKALGAMTDKQIGQEVLNIPK